MAKTIRFANSRSYRIVSYLALGWIFCEIIAYAQFVYFVEYGDPNYGGLEGLIYFFLLQVLAGFVAFGGLLATLIYWRAGRLKLWVGIIGLLPSTVYALIGIQSLFQ